MPGLPVGSAVDVARRTLDIQVRAMREVGDVVRFVVGPPGAVYPWATHRPFGGGPRTCIGAHFALLESLTVLAAVLDGYRLETPDRPIPVVPKITLHPARPVEARLTAI